MPDLEWYWFVVIYVLVCIGGNIVLWRDAMMKHNDNYNSFKRNPLLPRGWMIGVIWIIIFGFLGYSQYLVMKENDGWSVASVAIIVAAVFCLLYPVFIYIGARGDPVKSEKYARVINLLSLIVAFVLGLLVIRESDSAFWFILPLLVWASYVNFADSIYINFMKADEFKIAYL
jgi:tryptophan-rich sensory protein